MTRDGCWTLAALSAGAFTAVVAALVAYQLVPFILRAVVPGGHEPSSVWIQPVVGLTMSMGVVVGFAYAHRMVTRLGARLEGSSRTEATLALAIGIVPWIMYASWLWWQTR